MSNLELIVIYTIKYSDHDCFGPIKIKFLQRTPKTHAQNTFLPSSFDTGRICYALLVRILRRSPPIRSRFRRRHKDLNRSHSSGCSSTPFTDSNIANKPRCMPQTSTPVIQTSPPLIIPSEILRQTQSVPSPKCRSGPSHRRLANLQNRPSQTTTRPRQRPTQALSTKRFFLRESSPDFQI